MFWFVHAARSLFIRLPNFPCSQHTHTHSFCAVSKPVMAANSFNTIVDTEKVFWVSSSFRIMWPIEDVAAVPFPIMPLDTLANQNQIRAESLYIFHWD